MMMMMGEKSELLIQLPIFTLAMSEKISHIKVILAFSVPGSNVTLFNTACLTVRAMRLLLPGIRSY